VLFRQFLHYTFGSDVKDRLRLLAASTTYEYLTDLAPLDKAVGEVRGRDISRRDTTDLTTKQDIV